LGYEHRQRSVSLQVGQLEITNAVNSLGPVKNADKDNGYMILLSLPTILCRDDFNLIVDRKYFKPLFFSMISDFYFEEIFVKPF
jgi:hypothetical protein